MVKKYQRDTVRLAEKSGLINHSFKGQDMDDIIDNMATGHRCRLCGQPLSPYKNYYNAAIWRCNSEFCANNPDNPLKFDLDANFMNKVGNTDKIWDEWRPRRIA